MDDKLVGWAGPKKVTLKLRPRGAEADHAKGRGSVRPSPTGSRDLQWREPWRGARHGPVAIFDKEKSSR